MSDQEDQVVQSREIGLLTQMAKLWKHTIKYSLTIASNYQLQEVLVSNQKIMINRIKASNCGYLLIYNSTIFIINLQVIMATFIPKNAKQILTNAAKARDYFLKPYGLETPTNKNFPKKHPEYKFFEKKIILRRPGKEVNDNVLTFKADEKLAKPQIKQYLQKLYNLQIQKVNTVRYMGKVKRNPVGAPMITKNFKKVYVMTSHKIEPILNGVICN